MRLKKLGQLLRIARSERTDCPLTDESVRYWAVENTVLFPSFALVSWISKPGESAGPLFEQQRAIGPAEAEGVGHRVFEG
jgi:hypothetical protein